MLNRRRLALQLTPLLDLMLIVMFSQYLENRNRSVIAEEVLQTERQQIERQRQDMEQELRQQQETLDDLRQTYDARFRSLLGQHRAVADLLTRSLNLPEQALNEVVALRAEGSAEDAARLESAVDR
ncbi:MAG: hypothetical protein WCK86_16755, partial [Planctomycetia bacterium]